MRMIDLGDFSSEIAVAPLEGKHVFILVRSIRKVLLKWVSSSEEVGGQIGRLTRYWAISLGLYAFLSNFPRLPFLFRYAYRFLEVYLYLTATLAVIQISIW